MKRRIVYILFLLFILNVSAFAQFRDNPVYQELYDSETVASMKMHVSTLAASQLEGRKAGSEGEKMAAEYVSDQLKSYGVDVLSPEEGDIFGLKTASGDTLTSRNVVGYVQGYDPKLRNQYILVGARLDNLGSVSLTVDGDQVERIYYGANGNASGLAMMLELAKKVKKQSLMFRRSVLFVAFGASLESYAGAWYFINRSFGDAKSIETMINLDMLGTGNNGFYAYTASNVDLNLILRRLSGSLQPIQPKIVANEPYPSDNRAFYASEIPAVLFTTGKYPEHNTERDTQSIIDFDTMERELEYIYNFLLEVSGTNQQLAFKETATPSRGPAFDDVVPYYDCDQRPSFLNSQDIAPFMENWVYKNLKYPKDAIIEGIQGRVMIDFIIDVDGRVTDARVVRSVDPDLDEEALRIISTSPKWKPGKVNGKKVRTSVTVPVEFRLRKKGSKGGFGFKKHSIY